MRDERYENQNLAWFGMGELKSNIEAVDLEDEEGGTGVLDSSGAKIDHESINEGVKVHIPPHLDRIVLAF